MARHPIARVLGNQLIAGSNCDLPPIAVGTSAWYAWLDAPETRSFTYHTPAGRLTFRRELRHGCWYWYAYRARHGKLCKTYLGKSAELSQQHLNDALNKLGGSSSLADTPNKPGGLPVQKTQEVPAWDQEVSAWNELPVQNQKLSMQAQEALLDHRLFLLKSKLVPPPAPEYLVPRQRLLRLLQASTAQAVTLVCAPAGFGKTILAREWMAQSGRVCAWISLEQEDNDPWRFLAYLSEALQQIQPGLGAELLVRHAASSRPALSEAIVVLLNELSSFPTEMTLIFDNYQSIENTSIHHALAFFIEHLPAHVHVLITTRSEFPCSLARLRASGCVSELDADALRFTQAEIEMLLLEKMQLELSSAELALLEQRTEGWIAGLCLASFAMRGQRDLAHAVATFAGTNRSVLAYLLEEVLVPQPEPVQSFLLATSLLECLQGALCSAVTGVADAESMLEHLERANLFLFPFEKQVGCYRYHPLWAEALRHHLERTRPDQVAVLHARAGQWFEEQGQIEKAIEHALAAQDSARAVGLIERVASTFLMRGEILTLHRWMDALPEAVVRASPRLCVVRTWLVFITSQPDTFLGWVEAAEQALHVQQQTLPPLSLSELRAELVGLRAIYEVSFNDFSGAITACNQALQQLPPGNLYPRALLLMMLAFAYTRGTDVSAGARAASQANSLLQVTGHALLLPYIIISQAEIYLTQGYPSQAARLCRQILALAVEQNVPAVFAAGIAHVCLGQVFWEWNNLEMARSHLLQAWDLGTQTQTCNTLFLSALLLTLVSQAQGEAQEVDFWWRQIDALIQKVGQTEVAEQVAAVRALSFLADNRVEDALLWLRERLHVLENRGKAPDESERCAQAHILIAAGRAYADGSYVCRALELLTSLYTAAEKAGKVRSQLEILVLQSLALQLAGQNTDALATLGRAVALAEPGRYIRVFVHEGEPMARLLRQLLEQQRAQKMPGHALSLTYLSNLLKTFAPSSVPALSASSIAGEPVLDPLSWREHEVLRLLAAGRKNREIASELVVVTGTVKAHINTIYQKLGVSSRVQAVVRARSLGLL